MKSSKRINTLIQFVLLAILMATILLSLLFISPQEIVDTIGVENAYLVAFLISLLGGLSAGGAVSYMSVIVVLVLGGADPILLGLISGISLAMGDLLLFHFGSKGRALVTKKWGTRIQKTVEVLERKELLRRSIPILAYVYMGFSPFPNDLLLLFLAVIKYPYTYTVVTILLGDLTFALLLTHTAKVGV